METILGLDLGTNSVGWALIRRHEDNEKPDIEAGVYVFPEAGELDQGLFVSNRLKRGMKRRQRIQLRRRRQRLRKLMAELVRAGLMPQDENERARMMAADYAGKDRPHHPVILRKRGLDEPLSLYEFGRCIYHIGKHRGYMSTRDLIVRSLDKRLRPIAHPEPQLSEDAPDNDQPPDPEQKQMSALLDRLSEVRERIRRGEARTVGEFWANRLNEPGGFRASGNRRSKHTKPDQLGWRADRFLQEEEFKLLWDAQARHHPGTLTQALYNRLCEILFYQRPLSPKKGLVGACEFLPQFKRLPRATLLAQRCTILQTLANLTVQETEQSNERRLSGAEIRKLADELERLDRLTWTQAKDVLGMPHTARFSDEPEAPRGRSKKPVRGRNSLAGNRTAAAMREALGDKWTRLDRAQQEDLVNRLIYRRHPHNIVRGLRRDFGLEDDEIRRVASARLPEGYSNHCSRVWKMLEPHMREGYQYYEACVRAGFRAPNQSTVAPPETILPRLGAVPDLRNPVVQRGATMAFRVINAIIDKYGKPDRIRIEMPRDVSATNKQREEIWKQQDKNAREREAATKLLQENSLPTDRKSIDKVLLWLEAGCRSPYRPDQEVTINEVVHDYEIDHIVPRSRCWDDFWMNKTICSHGDNLEKGKRTPYEWLGSTHDWEKIELHLRALKSMPKPKRDRILRKEWEEAQFPNRALSDTRYVSRVVKSEVAKLGVPVDVSRGQLTALLRKIWGLQQCLPLTPEQEQKFDDWRSKSVKKNPKPRFDHRHHALDAILTALTDTRALQLLTAWFQDKELGKPSARVPHPKPWPTIAEDLTKLMAAVHVVHMPTRGVEGALHKETAYTPPDRAEVEDALAACGSRKPGKYPSTVIVGAHLVRLAPDGTPLAKYELGSNHHVVIWESENADNAGRRVRDVTVVSMIEAARRARAGEPLFQKEREGWRYVMALCKNDIVEWDGENPGLRRVNALSISDSAFELDLISPVDAQVDRKRMNRVRSRRDLAHIVRRVCLSPLGDIISSEPADAHDRPCG